MKSEKEIRIAAVVTELYSYVSIREGEMVNSMIAEGTISALKWLLGKDDNFELAVLASLELKDPSAGLGDATRLLLEEYKVSESDVLDFVKQMSETHKNDTENKSCVCGAKHG